MSATNENSNKNKINRVNFNICSTFIIEPIKDYLSFWLNNIEINNHINISPYNQLYQFVIENDIFKPNNYNCFFIRFTDWVDDLQLNDPLKTGEQLENIYNEFIHVIGDAIKNSYSTNIFFKVPSQLDDKEKKISQCIKGYDNKLVDFLSNLPRVHLVNLNELSNLYAVDKIHDATSNRIGRVPFTEEYYASIGTFIARKFYAENIKPYKVIVLDCDNTLWRGICGEDGWENLIIDEGYQYFQEFLNKKTKEGFILALSSKNNENDVWEVFEKHPKMLLKRDDIIAHRINWEPKSENIKQIKEQINVGLESFIFIDDSPYECEEVKSMAPELLCLQMPKKSEEIKSFLNHIWEFDKFTVTEEDIQRNDFYKAENKRNELKKSNTSIEDYIDSLKVEVFFEEITSDNINRAAQLFQRVNQFNLNGVIKSETEILENIASSTTIARLVIVKDKFGDYGLSGLFVIKNGKIDMELDTLLLSCRVLGRNVENIILGHITEVAKQNKHKHIVANYIPTEKNIPVKALFDKTGWGFNNGKYIYEVKNN